MPEQNSTDWNKEVSGWSDEISKVNNQELTNYRTYATTWRSNALKMEDARFGRQFSKAETKELLGVSSSTYANFRINCYM
jgi:hypothetical protein